MNSNPLREQVFSLEQLVPEQVWRLEDELRKIVPTRVQHAARHVVLTGCGDSAIAGRAAESAFRELAGLPTVATDAMTASRYLLPTYAGQYPHTPLLFALSNSGRVARVVEAAQRAHEVGGFVVALTASPDSPLALASDARVSTRIPEIAPGPGVRSYVEGLLGLTLFAIRFGEVRGRITMDQALVLRQEVAGLGDALAELAATADQPMRRLAEEWAEHGGVELLGAGPARASAAYGAAKILEAAGRRAVDIDLEEFVHLNYFVRDAEHTGTLVLSDHGYASASRAAEVSRYLTTLRRPWAAIGAVPNAPTTVALPPVRELFAPILHVAPLALFAGHLMEVTGESPGRDGVGQWSDCADGGTTTTSLIEGME